MKKTIQLVGIISATALLAACSTTGGGSSGGGSSGGGGGSGTPTSFTSPASAISAYAGLPTVTTHGAGGVTTAAGAMEQEGGTAIFGIGSGGTGGQAAAAAVAASNSTGVFKIGNIEVDRAGNKVHLTVDGVERTLSRVDVEPGFAEYYGYSWRKNPTGGESIVIADPMPDGDGYMSLVLHLKGADWVAVDGGYDIIGADEYNALIAGVLTPEANMPTTAGATYNGQWLLASGHAINEFYTSNGAFYLDADFTPGGGSLSGAAGYLVAEDDGRLTFTEASKLSGTIDGNSFTGKATATLTNSFEGGLAGGFFGPKAEQIAGTGTGTTGDGPASVVFFGQK